MHSLDIDQESDFLLALSKSLITGDTVYFEFRSEEDAETEKYFGNKNHFRRYVDSNRFIRDLNDIHQFDISYSITGNGMARYRGEDPVVTRIIAVKN